MTERELTAAERQDHQKIVAAQLPHPPVRRPLDVHRLDEIHKRVEWCEWTLTQDDTTPLEWRHLLADTRDLLTAFAERRP